MVTCMLGHGLQPGSPMLGPGGPAEGYAAHPRDQVPPAEAEGRPRLRLRPATRTDVEAIGRLGALLVRTHHELDPGRFIPATPGIEREYAAFLRRQLLNPDAVMLVAERDGEVLGYTYAAIEGSDCMSLRGPAGVLHDLMVDPAHRSGGVGRRLLEATLAALRARGAPRVVLSAAERNDAAKRLFAEAGFRPTMIEITRELSPPSFPSTSSTAPARPIA